MPRSESELSDFCKSNSWDLVMFGFVEGVCRALPSVPKEKALAIFAQNFGIENLNIKARRQRYGRMLEDLRKDQRTKEPEQV